ncbi:preprotein translocase subunit SecG [Arcanobacterium pluranimalium]|uniref:hypothetical protein n=1 Tax=Arcanobacterium pluranimalium TaxID=108028 RepID=UPI00195BBCFF|nr:hypothetical protein [Arcanobacterium pluranimalium]MBM7824982.1 preprotein translocase subunit SecG [Arcanobacterium pluranimalium]
MSMRRLWVAALGAFIVCGGFVGVAQASAQISEPSTSQTLISAQNRTHDAAFTAHDASVTTVHGTFIVRDASVTAAHAAYTARDLYFTSGEAEVNAWFNQNAQSLILAYAPDAFPKATASEVAKFSVGKPIRAAQFEAKGTKVGITESNVWVAPVRNQTNEPVGAISADFSDGKAKKDNVYGDPALGAAISIVDSARAVVFDEPLKAWFAVKESVVTSADAQAKKILLGSMPLDTFLIQRERLIGTGSVIGADDTASATPASSAKSQYLSPLQIMLIVLFVLAVVTVSLVWLRWEQAENAARKNDGERQIHRPESGKWSIVDHTKKSRKMRFRDSGGKISLYRKADLDKVESGSAGADARPAADSPMKSAGFATTTEKDDENEILDD